MPRWRANVQKPGAAEMTARALVMAASNSTCVSGDQGVLEDHSSTLPVSGSR
jgi:hypothetical protein